MKEAFEEVDGHFQFAATTIVYRPGSKIHHATSRARYSSSSSVKAEDFTNDIVIPVAAYSPPFSPAFTQAPDPLPPNVHVKKPSLASYDRNRESRPNCIADSLLEEVEICEVLRRFPHPSIATYLGCQVADGRITGICFTKYDSTLMKMVNPGSHMKRKSRSIRVAENYDSVLEGVERGIKHLHSLGIVHNDLNPSNIMLYGNLHPVIIDFDSCRKEGESMEGVGRTYEWYDEKIQTSRPENDFDALKEIQIWLGGDPNDFQFDE